MFKCECNKEFDNPQSYNGHKSHCKEHYIAKYGSLAEWEARRRKATKQIKAGSQKQQQKLLQERVEANLAWITAQSKCERCGNVMTEKFGSGRFCSRACANSRQHSAETKQKIHDTLNDTLQKTNNKPISARVFCKICGKELAKSNKTGFCLTCLKTTSEGKQARREAGRKGYETMVAKGTHKGWQSRKVISYAEKFWMQVLENNHIVYEREFLVHCDSTRYFLDFKIERNGKLIDLEIDGKQHIYKERAESDAVRDKKLQALDYLVYRISWNEINTEAGKQKMQLKINNFLNFYLAL